jgi:hypothetical protein
MTADTSDRPFRGLQVEVKASKKADRNSSDADDQADNGECMI